MKNKRIFGGGGQFVTSLIITTIICLVTFSDGYVRADAAFQEASSEPKILQFPVSGNKAGTFINLTNNADTYDSLAITCYDGEGIMIDLIYKNIEAGETINIDISSLPQNTRNVIFEFNGDVSGSIISGEEKIEQHSSIIDDSDNIDKYKIKSLRSGTNRASGTLIVNGSTVIGNIIQRGASDWYAFTVPRPSGIIFAVLPTVTIETWAGTLTNNYMILYGFSGEILSQDDDAGDGNAAKIVAQVQYGITYYVRIVAHLSASVQTGTYSIRVTTGSTTTITPTITTLTKGGATLSGNISPAGDVDWYSLRVVGSDYVLAIVPAPVNTTTIQTRLGTLSDNWMYLYGPDSQTTLISDNDDYYGSRAATIILTTPMRHSGTYYIKVKAYSSNQTGTYTIQAY